MDIFTNSRKLEIKVISGEDLRISGRRIKKNAFVIIQTDSRNVQSTKMETECGSHPTWNERLVIGMPTHARFVTVQVHCNNKFLGNKKIGTARIPVSDFVGGLWPDNYLHFLSYRLWDNKGKRNGIINLSVRMRTKPPENLIGGSNAILAKPWTGVPIAQEVSGGEGSSPIAPPAW